MENMVTTDFWRDKKVLITGHTGFKGSWLSLWLHSLGAKVIGCGLSPHTEPSMYLACQIDQLIDSRLQDLCNQKSTLDLLEKEQPDIIFHLAAQSLVPLSYKQPYDTIYTNIIGTLNLFDAIRKINLPCALINVTSDKCYKNQGWLWPYREDEALGGDDPYSCSKACSELLSTSYRNSFFKAGHCGLATVRAGNVLGGGDWAQDRLVPNIIRALSSDDVISLRHPNAVRPWQHVLEPLAGYLILAEKLNTHRLDYAQSWNFGPTAPASRSVLCVTKQVMKSWGKVVDCINLSEEKIHETEILRIDSSKARTTLRWKPKLSLEETIEWTVKWYKDFYQGKDMREISLKQIKNYQEHQ